MADMKIAKVVAVHPESHSVDLVFIDTGVRAPGIKVMSLGGSSNTGLVDLPVPTPQASSDPRNVVATNDRDVYAGVAFLGKIPVVLGFIYPETSALMFEQSNFKIERHASDVYKTVDADGNIEVYHPSGTYLRIGTSPAHVDLTGQDVDGKWAIKNNTDKAVHVHLAVGNAGSTVATLDIDPSGNIAVTNQGNTSVTTQGNTTLTTHGDVSMTNQGNLTVSTSGTANVTATGGATLQAPTVMIESPATTCTGALTVQGLLTYQAGMVGSGGTGATAAIDGNISVTGDVTAGGISLINHTHPVPEHAGESGPPVG